MESAVVQLGEWAVWAGYPRPRAEKAVDFEEGISIVMWRDGWARVDGAKRHCALQSVGHTDSTSTDLKPPRD